MKALNKMIMLAIVAAAIGLSSCDSSEHATDNDRDREHHDRDDHHEEHHDDHHDRDDHDHH